MKMTIFFNDEEIEFNEDQTLLHAALEHEILIDHSCGGNGTCGTCRVIVESDSSLLPPRNEIEAEMAEMRGFFENERLACQLKCQAQGKFKIP